MIGDGLATEHRGMDTQRFAALAASAAAAHDIGIGLSELAAQPTTGESLTAVREFLGMEVAFITRLDGDVMTVAAVDGDGETFLLTAGQELPFDQTYCQRMLSGRLPSVIADVRAEDRAASLAITDLADIGAFTTVALRFSDGAVRGTLCTASHRAAPSLGYRDLQYLQVAARMIADQLERDDLRRAAERAGGSGEGTLLAMTTELRAGALDLLETVSDRGAEPSGPAGVIDDLQLVANKLGSVERLLLPAA